MKIHPVQQGSHEWLALRLGRPTASEFERLVTPTGKLSSQARKYAFRLVAETLLNRSLDSIDNLEWVARGKALEPEAVQMYEFEHEVQTEPVGFITTDDERVGASPDRLIRGHNAALEIKCPSPAVHLEYMIDGFGPNHNIQVQGQMLVGEFEFVDRYSYNPEMPPVRRRTYRDEAMIAKLREALDSFLIDRDKILAAAQERGLYARRASVVSAVEHERGGPADDRYYAIPNPFAPGFPEQAPWSAG